MQATYWKTWPFLRRTSGQVATLPVRLIFATESACGLRFRGQMVVGCT